MTILANILNKFITRLCKTVHCFLKSLWMILEENQSRIFWGTSLCSYLPLFRLQSPSTRQPCLWYEKILLLHEPRQETVTHSSLAAYRSPCQLNTVGKFLLTLATPASWFLDVRRTAWVHRVLFTCTFECHLLATGHHFLCRSLAAEDFTTVTDVTSFNVSSHGRQLPATPTTQQPLDKNEHQHWSASSE